MRSCGSVRISANGISGFFNGLRRPDRRLVRGSMTVEAAVIVPCVVLVMAALLILCFFVHNRNYYKAAAAEAALVGNARYGDDLTGPSGTGAAEAAARQRMRERCGSQGMPGTEPETSVKCRKSGTIVSCSGQRFPMFPEDWFDYSVEMNVDKVWPASAVRKARAVRKTAGRLTGGGE